MQSPLSTRPDDDDLPSVALALSVLCDGEASSRQVDIALAAWSADAVSRQSWQDWHLIGDTLRSDELAQGRRSDEAFLGELRTRIAAEQAQPWRAARPAWVPGGLARRGLRWTGMALAAGVVGVVALGGVWQLAPAVLEDTVLAQAFQAVGWSQDPTALQAADGALIRDAQLDAYLRAHRAGAPALPGGATGRFETVALER
jgi:sigma-E factor negative regulatory protein RseA